MQKQEKCLQKPLTSCLVPNEILTDGKNWHFKVVASHPVSQKENVAVFICFACSQWGLLHLLSGNEKPPLYDISLSPNVTLSATSSRRQKWTLTRFLLALLTNAGTDRINNLFPSLMFTPASYNEDKSDLGRAYYYPTAIQLLSSSYPPIQERGFLHSCSNSSWHRWQESKSTTRIKPDPPPSISIGSKLVVHRLHEVDTGSILYLQFLFMFIIIVRLIGCL